MKLQTYLTREDLDDAAFGELIKRDRTTVYRLRTGKTLPDWDTVSLIVAATDGAVTANDFLPEPQTSEAAE